MEPWYEPIQMVTALGITIPLFFYFSWRIYCMIIEYGKTCKTLQDKDWVDLLLVGHWATDQTTVQLTLTNVYLKFDKDIGALRRSLRADAYNVILIGFVGTLVGMISSFASLMLSLGAKSQII